MEQITDHIGAISGIVALVLFFINYSLNRRKLKADTRSAELNADLQSMELINKLSAKLNEQEKRIELLETKVKALQGDNFGLNKEIEILEAKVKVLQGDNFELNRELLFYQEAVKEIHSCEFCKGEVKNCVAARKYHELKR